MIDKKLKKLGYIKQEEDEHRVVYLWEDKGMNRKRKVAIIRKLGMPHIIQVYDPDHIFGKYTAMDALTLKEMKLFYKKFKQMGRKYKWERY